MLVAEKLMSIQQELKAPKGQYNSFGKYKYRSCEDILEAVKPLLGKNKAALTITDELIYVGERYYIKAMAILTDAESGETIHNTAYARESLEKKGMDDSQITGTASSYARKYALNGLFCIDDTKDADTDEYENSRQGRQDAAHARQSSQQKRSSTSGATRQGTGSQGRQQATPQTQEPVFVNANHIKAIRMEMDRTGINERTILAMAKVGSFEEITMPVFNLIMQKFQNTKSREPAPADDFMDIPDGADEELPFR